MKILVLYGTVEGQTRKVCAFVAARLTALGHEVAVVDAGASPSVDVRGFQGAIVAASIHVGQYQRAVVEFVRANAAWLNRVPSAFLSVSLSAVSSDSEERASLTTIVDNFRAYTGWSGAEVHHVAGAIRMSEYDFFKRWVMRAIAWEKGLKLRREQDLELTDWDALGALVEALHVRFAAASASS